MTCTIVPAASQVNFKIKRANWDGTGDVVEPEEEEKKDDEVGASHFCLLFTSLHSCAMVDGREGRFHLGKTRSYDLLA